MHIYFQVRGQFWVDAHAMSKVFCFSKSETQYLSEKHGMTPRKFRLKFSQETKKYFH